MTVKELEFDAQHFIEAHTALVDVVVATATAIEFTEGSFFGNAYRRTVPLSLARQQQAREDSGGAAHRPTPRKAEHRPRGDTIRQAAYDNRFVSIAFIENRKIVRWRDYMDSLAAWTALTSGA
jgi:ketosteroid isomerase-like protein